jgi:hypothetical protein
MTARPVYAILGGGYWAHRMNLILGESRRVKRQQYTHQRAAESPDDYRVRLSRHLKAMGAQIAWLCVPPGPHVPVMVEAAFDAGLHVVAEKPWLVSVSETNALMDHGARKRCIFGIHYEFCFLEAVESWRAQYDAGVGLNFNGRFTTGAPDKHASLMDALDNLGSHLIAIRKHAAPQSRLTSLTCGYETANDRRVWLEKAGDTIAVCDFTKNREPIIQRFADRFEAATATGDFPLGFEFALQVAQGVADYRSIAVG